MAKHNDTTALLAHAHSLVEVLRKGSKNLSGMLPNLDELVSAAESMFPKRFAGNVEASAETGSLIKTFLVFFAVIAILYWVGYFFTVFTIEVIHSESLLRLFMEIIPIYPLSPGNLTNNNISLL